MSFGLLVFVVASVGAWLVRVLLRRRRESTSVIDLAEQRRIRGYERIAGRV